jgi:hypothetical protein
MPASCLDHEKLARVLGMLGSSHEGEILSAARQAERLRREAGVIWVDILLPALSPPRREREINTVEDAVELCLDFQGGLTAWERGFLQSIARRPHRLSAKQAKILAELVDECRAAERRANP